jgi:hypothetical protein
MEKLQKCVNFILTVPVFFATSCMSNTDTDFIILDENSVYANQISKFIHSV